jgi:predicted ATPase/class 3 adenylate cyclase
MSPDPATLAGGSAETLTFLFTDLEGSTRLWEKFPEAMKGALKRHDTILQEAVESPGGRVVKSTGDGTMAVFASAVDGVAACLAAQRALAREPWPETGPLKVRMGLHCGLAERRVDDFFGPTVNRTARLMAAGHGGQVLLSAAAAALAAERLPAGAGLRDLGEHRLKDLGRPEHVYQLLHADLAAEFPPLVTVTSLTANLPARAAAFIGRRSELDSIADCLGNASIRLLTLLGPGGTGKTALAIRAAEDAGPQFSDGVAFVDLASARDTGAVLVAIARAIGLGDGMDRPLREALVAYLRDRRTLLILDNFEQVSEAAGVIAELLADCPRLTLLVTSREALHVRAERVHPVPPLDLPPAGARPPTAAQVEAHEAAQLFIDRAKAIRPDFRLTDENAPAIAEICRRLDGLPLAIELAAARLRLLSPEALLAQLQNRLKLLKSGPRDLPERQQTLRAAMDWSYELLSPDEQRLFELLAVFADAAIDHVETLATEIDAAGDLDVLDGLGSLIEKSLVRRIETPGGEPRLAMLETIREFAADRLAQRPDFEARARRAHAEHYAIFAERMHAELIGSRRERALVDMAAEIGNLRIAWRYWVAAADLGQLERLTDSLLILNDARGWYLDTVGLTSDLLALLAARDTSPEGVGQEIALRVSLARALMATKGFTPEVEQAYTAAIELFERGTDRRQRYSVLRGLTRLYELRAEGEKASELGAEILAMGERENVLAMQIDGHRVVGTGEIFRHDLEGGLRHLETAIATFGSTSISAPADGQIGCDPRISCYTTSGLILLFMGYPDRAVGRANDALALASRLDHPFSLAYAHFHAGLLHYWLRSFAIARERTTTLLDLADEYDFRIWTAAGTCLRGAAEVGLGRHEGLAGVREGIGLYQGLRSPPVFWPMLLSVQAEASLRAGRPADGVPAIEGTLAMMGEGEGNALVPQFLIIRADLHEALAPQGSGDRSEAARLYQRALDMSARLKARAFQLRAATRLAGISTPGQDRAAALKTLASVYGAFTEGFDTADLAEARALLPASVAG